MFPLNSEVEGLGEVAVAVSTVPLATPGSDASGITNRNRLVVSRARRSAVDRTGAVAARVGVEVVGGAFDEGDQIRSTFAEAGRVRVGDEQFDRRAGPGEPAENRANSPLTSWPS